MLESASHTATLLPAKLLAFLNTGIKLKEFAVALLILAAMGLVVYVCYYLYRKQYPRPFFLFSSVSLGKQMQDIFDEMNVMYDSITKMQGSVPISIPMTIRFIEDNIVTTQPSFKQSTKKRPAPAKRCEDNSAPKKEGCDDPVKAASNPVCSADKVNIPKGEAHAATGETKFEIYLSHDNLLKSKIDKFIFRRVMKHFRKYSECRTDNIAGFEAVEAIVKEVEVVQKELDAAMVALDAFEATFPPDQAANLVDYCVSVRKLHFYFHHGTNQLKEMYDMRRWSLLNFLVVLMRPYVDQIIVKEIYMRWVDAFTWSNINESQKAFDKFWTWIGEGTRDATPYPKGKLLGTWPGLKIRYMLQSVIDFTNKLANE
jgi:hypothetical protein